MKGKGRKKGRDGKERDGRGRKEKGKGGEGRKRGALKLKGA